MYLRRAVVIFLLAAFPAGAKVLPPGIRPFRTYGTESGLGNLAAMRLAQDKGGKRGGRATAGSRVLADAITPEA